MESKSVMGTLRLQSMALLLVTIFVRSAITTFAQNSGVGTVVTADLFSTIFPDKNPFYTYDSFINAAEAFNAFGTTEDSTVETRSREITAFFAHCYHATSGLQYINQIDQSANYCDESGIHDQYPCVDGKKYYGRGPLQISWNYNYGPAGDSIDEDLLSNPDLVAQDTNVAFETALWFWTTPQSPKPSCQAVMNGTWAPSDEDNSAGRVAGFGLTINIINGGIECGPEADADGAAEAENRVDQYRDICEILNVDPGSNLGCSSMQPYSSS